jgi:hypothetical protein
MKKLAIVLISIFVLFTLIRFIGGAHQKSQMNTQPTVLTQSPTQSGIQTPSLPKDFTAAFSIYTQSTARVFTDPKYHNRSENVFLQAENPNIVQVKQPGATWQEFFDTLPTPMKLSKNCLITGLGERFCTGDAGTLLFYVNGKADPNALEKVIQPGDQLLITFGTLTQEQIQTQLNAIPKQ